MGYKNVPIIVYSQDGLRLFLAGELQRNGLKKNCLTAYSDLGNLNMIKELCNMGKPQVTACVRGLRKAKHNMAGWRE